MAPGRFINVAERRPLNNAISLGQSSSVAGNLGWALLRWTLFWPAVQCIAYEMGWLQSTNNRQVEIVHQDELLHPRSIVAVAKGMRGSQKTTASFPNRKWYLPVQPFPYLQCISHQSVHSKTNLHGSEGISLPITICRRRFNLTTLRKENSRCLRPTFIRDSVVVAYKQYILVSPNALLHSTVCKRTSEVDVHAARERHRPIGASIEAT